MYRGSLLFVGTVLAVLATVADTQEFKLGNVEFATSARSDQAQVHFLRGLAALHSFWYPVALDEFRASTKLEPAFLMGYWGEAMAHNHPIWGDPQNTETAREVLKNIKDLSRVTPRERAYLRAVQILYGEGDKRARDQAYAEAMEKLYQDYPDDLEAASFYALSRLGTVREMLHDPSSTRTRMKAAAIAQDVIRKAPNHPGAVHYLIHAFDDPDHALLALPAARRYAEIAPEAPHALHMPSHIFLQLGMWSEAAASNEDAWVASNKWVKQNNLPVSQRDYHSLHWLLYSYLQQGRYQEAEERLALMDKSLAKFPEDNTRNLMYAVYTRASMAAAFVVETERWDTAENLLSPPLETARDSRTSSGSHTPSHLVVDGRASSVGHC